jgi:hypothetical protein
VVVPGGIFYTSIKSIFGTSGGRKNQPNFMDCKKVISVPFTAHSGFTGRRGVAEKLIRLKNWFTI